MEGMWVLLTWMCGMFDPLDPIKPRGSQIHSVQQLVCLLPVYCSSSTMSLINNCTFEHSMGHQISQQDALFHLHTSDGQHYLSNQQVMCCFRFNLMNLTSAFIVGGLGLDARGMVPSLGTQSNAGRPAVASDPGNGSGFGVTSWFGART